MRKNIDHISKSPLEGDNIEKEDERTVSVLNIDDDEGFLEISKIYLEKYSQGVFKVDSLVDPSKALELLEQKKFDIIISDYQMPEMDGLELLKLIRYSNNDIPFIIFTGKGREEVVIEALNLGANHYIKKGTDVKSQFIELVHTAKNVVNLRRVEAAYIRSKTRYKKLVDTMNDGLGILDINDSYVYVNNRYCEMLEYTKEELIGKKVDALVSEGDLDKFKGFFDFTNRQLFRPS